MLSFRSKTLKAEAPAPGAAADNKPAPKAEAAKPETPKAETPAADPEKPEGDEPESEETDPKDERIAELEGELEEMGARVSTLEERVTALEAGKSEEKPAEDKPDAKAGKTGAQPSAPAAPAAEAPKDQPKVEAKAPTNRDEFLAGCHTQPDTKSASAYYAAHGHLLR